MPITNASAQNGSGHRRVPLSSLRVCGDFACFTRPEFKVERVSYPVMTPSAARGILEAVLWKPAIRWRIERIKVLSPIVFVPIRRNEVDHIANTPPPTLIAQGGSFREFFIEDRRQQRNTIALQNVDYIIEARFELTEKAGRDDSATKFAEMFRRRVERGQCFHHPYLGCREFVGDIHPVSDVLHQPIEDSKDLGLMLWDISYKPGRNRPIFFPAKLERGVLNVPANPEASVAIS
jgi:CRISPR-associated protein Cas5d